jgi:hypothetical protein
VANREDDGIEGIVWFLSMIAREGFREYLQMGMLDTDDTVSFVIVVGEKSTAVHPYRGDALMALVVSGAPLHSMWDTRW